MKNILFRSSGVGNLMVDAKGSFTTSDQKTIDSLQYKKTEVKGLTEKQTSLLEELRSKENPTDKQLKTILDLEDKQVRITGLTPKQQATLDELLRKQAKPFELSETAKKFVLATWLKNEYGYQEPLNTFPIQKGRMCEQDVLALATKYIEGGYRKSNAKRKKNDHFTGLIDTGVFLPDEKVIEDMKASFTLKTFVEAKLTKLYYCQIQSYIDLWDADKGRLVYGLVNTPPVIFEKLEKRLIFSFDGDVDNIDFQEQHEQLHKMHHPEEYIPAQQRIKYFEFDRNQAWIDEMKRRCEPGNEYYHSLELGAIDTTEIEKFIKPKHSMLLNEAA